MQKVLDGKVTIFAQFDRSNPLARILVSSAAKRGIRVFWGEDGSPDLFAIDAFLMVIDRASVGIENYNAFVAYTTEVNSGDIDISDPELNADFEAARIVSTCVIVDAFRGLAVPKLPIVVQIDPEVVNLANCVDALISLGTSAYSG